MLTLEEDQLQDHKHVFSDPGHYHGVTDPGHRHSYDDGVNQNTYNGVDCGGSCNRAIGEKQIRIPPGQLTAKVQGSVLTATVLVCL